MAQHRREQLGGEPGRFGKWKAFGGADLGLRGGSVDLRVEVEWYRKLERLARFNWRREMKNVASREQGHAGL